MSNHSPSIVITGMGIVSPLGTGREAYQRGLAAQKGVVVAADRAGEVIAGIRVKSRVEDFRPQNLVRPRKSAKLMCREVAMGVAAAELAVSDSGMSLDEVDAERFGAVVGSEMLYGPVDELASLYQKTIDGGSFDLKSFGNSIQKLFPLWLLKYLPNMASCHLAIAQQALAHNNSIVQGDASALLALIEAMSVMERGRADIMIAGGAGSLLHPVRNLTLHDSLFSDGEPSPESACRPFDASRSGIVCGEGAAMFVLETETHARARGAVALARLIGQGRSFGFAVSPDTMGENGPSSQAIARSIDLALSRAGRTAAQIDHVNAHGLATKASDHREAVAIRQTLGDVPVTALKSYFGNLGAGSGAVELAASVLALSDSPVYPTLHFSQPDSKCPVNVLTEKRALLKETVVALSQSSTGQSAAVVLERV